MKQLIALLITLPLLAQNPVTRQGALNTRFYAHDTGGDDAYVVATPTNGGACPAALADGLTVELVVDFTNDEDATLNFCGLGALEISAALAGTNLTDGDLVVGKPYLLRFYDSTPDLWIVTLPGASGGTIPATTSALIGDGAGNASAAGCWAVFQPTNRTCFFMNEEFIGVGFSVSSPSYRGVGSYAWNIGGTGATAPGGGSGEEQHPGTIRFEASGGTTETRWVILDGLGVTDEKSCPPFDSGSGLAEFHLRITFKFVSISDTGKFFLGCSDSTTFDGGDFIGIRFTSNSGDTCDAEDATSTTNIMVAVGNGGTISCEDLGINLADDTWYVVHIYGTAAGTLNAEIATGSGAFGSPVTLNSNMADANMYPLLFAQQDSANTARVFVDQYLLVLDGVDR